jgi:Tol biopolymer transport system component
MTPERWVRVQEVFHAATERSPESRAAFLDEACRGDPELRKEVESLFSTSDDVPSGFLESPAIEDLPALSATEIAAPRPVRKGMRLGPYEILAPLGAGGMGEVYRARDERLGREVAIKVLPAEVAADSQRLRRFEKEARSASALNHPNIVTIYDIGQSDGISFIAMELVNGQTLRDPLKHGVIPTKRLLAIATQAADGLAKAHEAGIVHRDLKPENVMVTKEGLVKLLDFGLAKLTSTGSGSSGEGSKLPTMTGTTPGVIVGTVGYMSPEQANGERIDFRSDQFSLGSILYEMAAGKRAFQKKTPIDTLGAILNEEPEPLAAVNPKAPTQLRWIVERCLAKDPRQRYSSTDDLARDLAHLRDHLSEATSGVAPGARARRRLGRPALIGAAALLLVAGAALVLRLTKPQPTPGPPLKVRQLTANSAENPVGSGDLSLDGKYLAYADRTGMHVELIETGEVRSIPEPEELKGRGTGWEIGPWHPDGTRFYVNAHTRSGDGGGPSSAGTSIWSVLVMGGPPRKLREDADVISVSPDGASVAFGTKNWSRPKPDGSTEDGDREIWLMGPGGEHAHKQFEADANGTLLGLLWFRDGQRVAYTRVGESTSRAVSQDLKGGTMTTILPSKWVDPDVLEKSNSGAWSPDGRWIYSMPEPERDNFTGTSYNFWELPIDPHTGEVLGKPRRLTSWTGFSINASGTIGDGKRLAFLRWASLSTVYLASLDAGGAVIGIPRHFTLSESESWPVGWTADGKTLVFISDRNGHNGIYRQSVTDETAEPLVAGPEGAEDACVSADGAWVIYRASSESGDSKLPVQFMRTPIAGGSSQLVFTARKDAWLGCARSPSRLCVVGEPTEDRKQAVFSSFDPVKGRGAELIRTDMDPQKRNFGSAGFLSPDGTRIAFFSYSPGDPIQIHSLQGQPTQEVRVKGWKDVGSLRWAADGKGFFVGTVSAGTAFLLHVDLQGNATVFWQQPGAHWLAGVESPDGRHLAIVGANTSTNMWMMENF